MDSFLQSKQWLNFQRSIGRGVFEYDKKNIRAGIIEHDLPYTKKTYLYIPHGPIIKETRDLKDFMVFLRKTGRSRSVFVKAEPLENETAAVLAESGFIKSDKEIQPTQTTALDLAQSEEQILARMHHKSRYNIRVAEKYNVSTEERKEIEPFLNMLKQTAERDGFYAHTDGYYRSLVDFFSEPGFVRGRIFVSEYLNKPAAAAVILIHKNTGYYIHGASDYRARAVMAPYALHWHIIKFLKSQGISRYDLWGIDSRRWPGVTRFKLGWGGDIVKRPGSFDMPLNKFWYFIYGLSRKIF